MVRVSVGVASTERHHVDALWALMQDAATAAIDDLTDEDEDGDEDGAR